MNERNNASTPSTTQVERMREIIVGRQLGKVEQRLDRLEQQVTQTVPLPDAIMRMEDMEARFEALRDALQHQMDHMRRELGGEMVHRKQEVRRLAEQIQHSAQAKMTTLASQQEIASLESRLVHWLTSWQQSVELHVEQRERWLVGQLREELQRQSLTQPDHHNAMVQEQIATAAQALSHTATTLTQLAATFSAR
jgi:hypothetical protein